MSINNSPKRCRVPLCLHCFHWVICDRNWLFISLQWSGLVDSHVKPSQIHVNRCREDMGNHSNDVAGTTFTRPLNQIQSLVCVPFCSILWRKANPKLFLLFILSTSLPNNNSAVYLIEKWINISKQMHASLSYAWWSASEDSCCMAFMFCTASEADVRHVRCRLQSPCHRLTVLFTRACISLPLWALRRDNQNSVRENRQMLWEDKPEVFKAQEEMQGAVQNGMNGQCKKGTFTDLNGVVNDCQISRNAAAEEQIEGCRLHSGRKSIWESKHIEIKVSTRCIWTQKYVPVHHNLLAHLIKKGNVRVPVWREMVDH